MTMPCNTSISTESLTSSRGSSNRSIRAPPIKPKKEDFEIESLLDKAKFYASICLGTTAILSVFAFLFLIPFVVDPAISTIIADYDPVPVTCVVIDHIYAEGIKNCTWSSCREGCTSSLTKCHQFYVNYSRIPFNEWQNRPNPIHWDVSFTRFQINSEGCGYPPTTNCTTFARTYGYSNIGQPFPCYYSRAYPEIVIGRYSWENNLYNLILSLIIPNTLFAISIGILSYWYCRCCDKPWSKSTRVYSEKFQSKEFKIN